MYNSRFVIKIGIVKKQNITVIVLSMMIWGVLILVMI
jgi:hypothetical protein